MAVVDTGRRWAEDEIRADVQDALSALRTARDVLAVVSEELRVARELEALERERFALGDSTQFLVNLREVATADAALREVKARADQQKALVAVAPTMLIMVYHILKRREPFREIGGDHFARRSIEDQRKSLVRKLESPRVSRTLAPPPPEPTIAQASPSEA